MMHHRAAPIFALALAGLILGLPAKAQETAPATPAAPAAPAADPAAGADANGLDANGLVKDAASAAVGQAYAGPVNGDWPTRCFKTEDGSDPCEMFQLLSDGVLTTGGKMNTIAEISAFDLPDGGEAVMGMAVMVPLETDLQSGLVMVIDQGKPKVFPFSFCTQAGCLARIGLTSGDVAELKKGAMGKLLIAPAAAPDQPVKIDLSLKGFTAAADALPQAPNP